MAEMKFDWSILTEKDRVMAGGILRAIVDLGDGNLGYQWPESDLCIAPDGNPYLWRWHLARTDFGGVYFHIQVADDPERPLHDHPWDNCSVILSGGYDEILDDTPSAFEGNYTGYNLPRTFKRRAGDVVYRKAEWAHRLLLPPGFRYTMTLFTFGPKRRIWGFWFKDGWRPYTDVTETKDGVSVHHKPTMGD